MKSCAIFYNDNREDFTSWILARMPKDTALKYIRYTDRYLTDLPLQNQCDIVQLSSTVQTGWNWYAKALRNYIHFLEDRNILTSDQAIEWKKPLSMKSTNPDTWVPDVEDIQNVLKAAQNPTYVHFMQLLLYSGIRTTEAIHIVHNFDVKRLHFSGDVAYYDIDWNRGNKHAIKAFMPSDFARTLQRTPDISINAVQKYFRVRGIGLKYCRNLFIDQCVKVGISESLIQYMIGHTNGSVLMTNYLEKLNNSTVAYAKVSANLQDIINTRKQ